jgi:hypothetical protein
VRFFHHRSSSGTSQQRLELGAGTASFKLTDARHESGRRFANSSYGPASR